MSKKYVITDPCYILPEEDWRKCCDYADKTSKEDNNDWSEIFHTAVEMALTRFTNASSWADSTGFGDWTNALWGPNVNGTGAFFADSGSVCVCEYTDKVAEALGDLTEKDGAAVFEAEGPIEVEFDRSDSSWTIVNIEDANGDCWHTDIPYDPDEDEEDEEW